MDIERRKKKPLPASLEMNILTLEAIVWQQIVANYVMPSTHELSITTTVAILIWLILERKTVNLPPLIRNSMFKVNQIARYSLPFPCMIMKLAAKVRVPWESKDAIYRVPNNKRTLPHGNWYKGDKAPNRKRKRSGAGTSTESAAPPQQPQHFHQFTQMVTRELASIKRKIIRDSENSKKIAQQINPMVDFSGLEPHTPEGEQTESDPDSSDEIPPMDLHPLQTLPPEG